MRFSCLLASVLAISTFATCAYPSAQAAMGAPPGSVSVSWSDPGQFSEARGTRSETRRAREAWISELACFLAERAAEALPADQRLELRFTDIRRVGMLELRQTTASSVRVVRDISSSPRIALEFKRTTLDGRVLQVGSRELRDQAFMMRPARFSAGPLGPEKMLLDDWVRKEFSEPH